LDPEQHGSALILVECGSGSGYRRAKRSEKIEKKRINFFILSSRSSAGSSLVEVVEGL
jgi:hypothetical protein